jgi:hypothetical protein
MALGWPGRSRGAARPSIGPAYVSVFLCRSDRIGRIDEASSNRSCGALAAVRLSCQMKRIPRAPHVLLIPHRRKLLTPSLAPPAPTAAFHACVRQLSRAVGSFKVYHISLPLSLVFSVLFDPAAGSCDAEQPPGGQACHEGARQRVELSGLDSVQPLATPSPAASPLESRARYKSCGAGFQGELVTVRAVRLPGRCGNWRNSPARRATPEHHQ